jgi:hypothetical protein
MRANHSIGRTVSGGLCPPVTAAYIKRKAPHKVSFTVSEAMHYSRLCALLIDCNASDVDQAAGFWAQALGRAIDAEHPGTRGNYRMLETPLDEPVVQIQPVVGEITGRVGTSSLTFVLYVEKVGDGPSWRFEGLERGWRGSTG